MAESLKQYEAVTSQDSLDESVTLHGLTGYINAGGRGTRLDTIFSPSPRLGISKALLEIGRPPITLVEHHINKLDHAGVPTIVAGVGDHENVAEHVRTRYAARDTIHAIQYDDQLGNGGDLVRAVRDRPELFADDIFITCVDVLLDIDESEFLAFHRDRGGELSIALTRNRGVPNEGAYYVGPEDEVVYCGEVSQNRIPEDVAAQRSTYKGSSTGALIARKDALSGMEWQPEDGPLSLYDSVVAVALGRGSMFAFDNSRRLFTDIGTVNSWNALQVNYDTVAPYIHYEN